VLTYTEYFTYAMLQREYSINVGHLQKNGREWHGCWVHGAVCGLPAVRMK
jgi:hypothetical protein